MKNVRLFCCFLAILLFSSINNAAFCDENNKGGSSFLDSYVVNELNNGIINSNLNTKNITKYDYSLVDSLTIDFYDIYKNIDNLNDLYNLKNLSSLNIEFNEFSPYYKQDINFEDLVLNKLSIDFDKFKNLNTITIDSPYLNYNFEFIKNAKNIKTLNIHSLNSDDLSFLSSLKNLRNMTISNTNISNLDFLSNLNEIHNLSLICNKNLEDISKLAVLPNLNNLKIDDCNKLNNKDFFDLDLKNTYILNLSNLKNVSDLSFLNNYEKLYDLDLIGMNIDDLYFVETNTSIKDFYIEKSKVLSYSSLKSLKKNPTILNSLKNENFELSNKDSYEYKKLSDVLNTEFVFKNHTIYFKNSNTVFLD